MRSIWLGITLVAIAWGGESRAQGREAAVAVLGLEPRDGAEQVAGTLTYALRQRAAGTRGFAMVPGKELIEIKLVFNCVDEGAACLTQAGKSLSADKLLYGYVRKVSPGYAVQLKWFDVPSGRIEKSISDTFLENQASAAALQGLARGWFAALTGAKAGGVLRVQVSAPGAEVSLDGKVLGRSGDRPLEVAEVAPGEHTVRVAKAGYKKAVERVTVRSGEVAQLAVSLEAESAVAAPTDRPVPGSGYRMAFYGVLGGTVAALGATVAFGLKVRSLEEQKRDQIRAAMVDSDPSNDISPSGDACAQAKGRNAALTRTCDDGSRYALLTNVALGVGAGLAVAGAYLFYRGFLDEAPAEAHASRRSRLARVRLLPEVAASGAGLWALLEF